MSDEKPNVGAGYRGSDGAMTCALCDTEMEWVDCQACGGDGVFDAYEEDPINYAPGDLLDCNQCAGEGGEYWCHTSDCKTITCTRIIPKPEA